MQNKRTWQGLGWDVELLVFIDPVLIVAWNQLADILIPERHPNPRGPDLLELVLAIADLFVEQRKPHNSGQGQDKQ
jgi:hypothetical protein